MAKELQYVDTTLRDGTQSLWAAESRTGMVEAVAEDLDKAGFQVVEVPLMPYNFKKIIRDLKEDPWELTKIVGEKMPNAKKAFMGEPGLVLFELLETPPSVAKLFYDLLIERGALNRVQTMANIFGNLKTDFPWFLPYLRSKGMEIAHAVAYSISPRHTDEYFAKKTKEVAANKPDVIYFKDAAGLLTVESLRRLLPIIIENSNGIPVEFHTHGTTGLADELYVEAMKLGVRTLHTAIPPLAGGSGQPSVFTTVANAKYLDFDHNLDLERIQRISDRLMVVAKADNLPIGAPLEYDYSQYIHQVPGGVISNLHHQLKAMNLHNRVNEVVEESIRIRAELGYPVMITPYSQFMVTQAAINVATGERYKVVIDELIQFAAGIYSEDSGYLMMDQNLKDKFLNLPRAKELHYEAVEDIPIKKVKEQFGGPTLSDEEFMLRYIMKGTKDIEEMRKAGPYRQYFSASTPLAQLLDRLSKQPDITHVQIQGHSGSLVLTNN
ncbi:hypothetical protein [Bacillus sp. UNC438CL73TsuS30]|uniref:hypothetical protein n=1 Tax=Bacillus sp. UNC438CL73TsuS30 TaxID=1340434 RepID=UPI00047C5CEE|nr:hypothetical protein [Bacillus sp. UNC438CL73TsuS30]